MTHWKWASRLLGFLALIVRSAIAIAGDAGETSRGAVSISITIPPHVKVSDGPVGKMTEDGASLFIESRQVGSYHVALDRPTDGNAAAVLPQQSGRMAAMLQRGPAVSDRPTRVPLNNFRQSLATSSDPLVILIIPD